MNNVTKKGNWIMVKPIVVPIEMPVRPLTIAFAKKTKDIYMESTLIGNFHSMDFVPDSVVSEALSTLQINKKADISGRYSNGLWYGKKAIERVIESAESQVSILTREGQAVLQPWEYTIASDDLFEEMLNESQRGGCDIVYMDRSKRFASKIDEQIFYCMQRGFSKSSSLKLIGGKNINTQHLFYLEPHEEYLKMFVRDSLLEHYKNKVLEWNKSKKT